MVSARGAKPERYELIESGFDRWVGQAIGAQARIPFCFLELPARVDFEVSRSRGHRQPFAVVEDDETAGTYEFAQEEEIHEHVVEDVAPSR